MNESYRMEALVPMSIVNDEIPIVSEETLKAERNHGILEFNFINNI